MKFIASSIDDTKKIAQMFRNNVFPFSNVLLFGEMWVWKTHFIKYLLEAIWVKKNVRSPTYAFSNYYKTKWWNIWHYDLYRLEGKQSLPEIEEHFNSSDDFVIVEWAEKLKVKPKRRIEVYVSQESSTRDSSGDMNCHSRENGNLSPYSLRQIEFKFHWVSMSKDEIDKIFKEYKTPKHVLNHIEKVTSVADKVANNLIKNWVLVDKDLVHSGAMLHDFIRYIDFNWWLQREKIPYKCSDDDFEFWKKMEKKYKGIHHAIVANEILCSKWYPELWSVVMAHKSRQIFEWFNTIEEKIVYYADKRVVHDEIVSIKHRIEDWKKRYSREWDDWYWNDMEKKLIELESELMVEDY